MSIVAPVIQNSVSLTDYGFVKAAQIYARRCVDTSNVVSDVQITRRYFSPQVS
jgi:hypothetical protein